MPKEKRDAIEQEAEMFGYLKQSHISAKNVARMKVLAGSSDATIAELAALVIEVSKLQPHKRGRIKVLARERRDLLEALERTGLIFAHYG